MKLARLRQDGEKTARSRDREEASSWCASYGFIGAVTVVIAVARRAQLGHFRWRVPDSVVPMERLSLCLPVMVHFGMHCVRVPSLAHFRIINPRILSTISMHC